jgi:hypothetical protein
MKSIEELYQEVMEDETRKAEFITAYREGTVGDFLKAHDCDATVEEVEEYVKGQRDEELSLDDLGSVAGGGGCRDTASCGDYCTVATCRCH